MPGRIEGRMRPEIRGHKEKRLPRITPSQKVYASLGNPVGGMVFFLMHPGPRHITVAFNPRICHIGGNSQLIFQPVEIIVGYQLGLAVGNRCPPGISQISVMKLHMMKAQIIS